MNNYVLHICNACLNELCLFVGGRTGGHCAGSLHWPGPSLQVAGTRCLLESGKKSTQDIVVATWNISHVHVLAWHFWTLVDKGVQYGWIDSYRSRDSLVLMQHLAWLISNVLLSAGGHARGRSGVSVRWWWRETFLWNHSLYGLLCTQSLRQTQYDPRWCHIGESVVATLASQLCMWKN